MMKAAMIVGKDSSDEDHADEEDKEAALAKHAQERSHHVGDGD